MISTFRKQKRLLSIFLWLVIAAFLGTIFLVWGVGDQTSNRSNYAMKVNDYNISYDEYQNTYESTLNTMRELFGEQVDKIPEMNNIQKQVINELKNKYLLLGEANRLNIPVSDIEVMSELSSISSFTENGEFSPQRYTNVLRANGITPAAFESSLKEDIKISKLRNLIKNSTYATKQEIKNEFLYRNKKAQIKYITMRPSQFKNQVEITEKALQKYFNENKENYRIPEEIKVKYVEFDPENYNYNIEINNKDIENYYIQNKEEFEQPEQVRASHILIRVNNFDNESEVKKAKSLLEEVLRKYKAGTSFEELAKKYSEDPSSANGGDLGYFQRGEMIEEFEKAAFDLNTGEVSDIVKTPFGFHLIKVTDHKEERNLSLQEAKPEIKEKLESMVKEETFSRKIYETYRKILNASNISAFQENNNDNITVETTDFFNIYEDIYPFNGNMNIKEELFNLEPAEISNVVTIGENKYIFEIVDKKDSFIPPIEEVKDTVTKNYITDQSLILAENRAKNLINKFNSIKDISNELKKNYSTTPMFTRMEGIPDIGISSRLTEDIFAAGENSLLPQPYVVDERVFIVETGKYTKPDFDENGEYPEIKKYIENIKRDSAVQSYTDKLEKNAKIWVAPSLQEYLQ